MSQNRSLSLATVALVLLPGFGTTAMAAQVKPTRVPLAWTTATPMPLSDAVIEYGRAQCDNQPNSFYVIEGNNQTVARTTKAWRYDADTDTWNVLAPIPNPPGNVGAVAVCHQGFIYVAGGAHVGFNRLFIYDVANDTWSAGVDATSGDIGPVLQVQRMGPDGTTVIQNSDPIAAGLDFSRSLRWANSTAAEVTTEFVRVSSEITVLLLQNPTDYDITGNIYFWDTAGTLVATQPFTLTPKQVQVLNTAMVAPGVGGAVTVTHDGRFGDLAGKTVALEPATGFSFDSPMLPRVKMN